MIRVLTSTCLKHMDMVRRVVDQMKDQGIDHHLFVEDGEFEHFARNIGRDVQMHHKPNGGEGGLGRSGTLVKAVTWRQMVALSSDDDTVINIDSDVVFDTPDIVHDLVCQPGEIKAFGCREPYPGTNTTFLHLSGMLYAKHAGVLRQAMQTDVTAGINYLMERNMCPSEDVVLSYMLQTYGGVTSIKNLDDTHSRGVAPPPGRIEGHYHFITRLV